MRHIHSHTKRKSREGQSNTHTHTHTHTRTTDRITTPLAGSARPNQSLMFPYYVNRFQKGISIIVQYKYLKSCSGDFILQNLILRTRSCGSGFITPSSCVFRFHQTIMVGPSWSCGNVLYHSCTSSEGASRTGQTLNNFIRFIGAGGWGVGCKVEDLRFRVLVLGCRS